MTVGSALFGIVDLGTWNIRFSISSVQSKHARILPCVFQDRAPIRLYNGPDKKITDDQIKATIIALRRFCSICTDYGVPQGNVKIAANPHEAPNFDELVDEIKTGLNLDVLRLNKEGEHWANAYGIASAVHEARGIYVELRPTYANIYYLNLCSSPEILCATDKTSGETLFGPVRVSYVSNSKYKVQTIEGKDPWKEHSNGTEFDSQGDSVDLGDFKRRLTEACSALLAQAAKSNIQSSTVFLSGSGFFGLHTLLATITPGFCVTTNGLVIKPSQLTRIEAKSRIVRVLQVLGSSLPPSISRLIYIHHNLRNGLLFQALPVQIRMQDPLIIATKPYALPGAPQLAEELKKALPPHLCPRLICERLVYVVANAAYIHSSYPPEVQSFSALVVAETGILSGTHGITHEEKALLGLALCQRWGGYIDSHALRIQRGMIESMTDGNLAWWAMYLGIVMHLLGAGYPGAHVRSNTLEVAYEDIATETSGKDTKQSSKSFKLVVNLKSDSLYGDNIIMQKRVEHTIATLERVAGPRVQIVVNKL